MFLLHSVLSLIAKILIRMSRWRSDSNTCNTIDLQEENFTQDATVRLQPGHNLAHFLLLHHISITALAAKWAEPGITHLLQDFHMYKVRGANQASLSVAQLEISLERQLMIVIKLIRLHLLFTGSKYISGTLNLTC